MTRSVKDHVARLLTAPWIGAVAGFVCGERIPYRSIRIDVSHPAFSPRVKAALLWRVYEGAEVRMIRRYLAGADCVVELGASLGVTGAHAVSVMANQGRYFGVEASPGLFHVASATIRQHARTQTVSLTCGAIDYQSPDDEVPFVEAAETTSGRLEVGDEEGIAVPRLTLSDLALDGGGYALICDIEGAEVGLLLHEDLSACEVAVFELHASSYDGRSYSVAELESLLLERHGFQKIDGRGRVVVVARDAGKS